MDNEEMNVKQCPPGEESEDSIKKRFPQDKFPVTSAYVEQLLCKVPGDPKERTFGQLIAQATVCRAAKGDVRAAKELREATGGLFVQLYLDVISQFETSRQQEKATKK